MYSKLLVTLTLCGLFVGCATRQVKVAPQPTVMELTTHSVSLSWNATSGNPTYNIYRSMTSGSGYVRRVSGLTATNWKDSNVTSKKTYYYVATFTKRVNGKNVESSYSNQVSATIP